MSKTTLFLVAMTLATAAAMAAPPKELVFSKFSGDLKLVAADQEGPIHRYVFRGTVTLTGTFWVSPGMDVQRFTPDAASRNLLPAVVAGPSASPITYIDLTAPDDQVYAMFGERVTRVTAGEQALLKAPATIVVHTFSTQVECGGRRYVADDVTVLPAPRGYLMATNEKEPHGC